MYRSIRRALAAAGATSVLVVAGAGAAHATSSYLGPVYPAPGGNSFTATGGDGAIASAGGETWTFGGFDTSQFGQMVWGPWDANSVKLSFDDISDTSYGTSGEVLQFDSADSNLAGGKIVFTGHADMSIFNGSGYTPTSFDTRFTLLATDLSNTPISLVDPSLLGLAGGIGGQVSVNDNLSGYKVNMLFEASPDGNTWTPANDLFNSIGNSQGTDPATEVHTSFDAGFYYTPTAPPLTITPSSHDYGSVVIGTQSASQTFAFQNTSADPVTLNLSGTQASGDANEFQLQGGTCTDGETLNNGESCEVDLAFAPNSAGPASATFTLVDESDVPLGSFTLTGAGVSPATLTATPLDFGTVYAGASAKLTTVISNTATTDATGFGLAISGPNASAFRLVSKTCENTLVAGHSCTATIRFKASGAGDRHATLNVTSDGASVDVPLDGTSVASADMHVDISENPESPVASGGQVTWTLTVWNTGPSGAKGISLSDTLPAGTRFASVTPSTGKCTAPHVGAVGTVVCKLGRLGKSGGPVTVSLTATITASAGQTIANTASVSSKTHDPHPENNSTTIDTDVS